MKKLFLVMLLMFVVLFSAGAYQYEIECQTQFPVEFAICALPDVAAGNYGYVLVPPGVYKNKYEADADYIVIGVRNGQGPVGIVIRFYDRTGTYLLDKECTLVFGGNSAVIIFHPLNQAVPAKTDITDG